MKVLIIGARGFIGKAVSTYLKDRGYEIVEADIVHDCGWENYVQLDSSLPDFERLFLNQSFDACINCSGAAKVSESFEAPLLDYRLNTVNVYGVLNAIKRNTPSCYFITLSSAAVYGNPIKLPITEDLTTEPVSPYGFHKLQSEEICQYFARLFNIDTAVLRVFSAYGPGLKKQLFWDLYQKFLESEKQIELFGSGEETRDFIYIDDLCKVLELILKGRTEGYKVYNVASGKESKIKDVAIEFYNQLGYTGNIVFSNTDLPGYPSKWVADISCLTELGMGYFTSLEEGISNYIEWVKRT